MIPLIESPKYKSFVQKRNKEIEQIQLNAQVDVSRLLFEALDNITGFISHQGIQGRLTLYNLDYLSKTVDAYIWQQFQKLLSLVLGRLKRMRRATFVITYLSELEAIARATQKTFQPSLHEFKMKLSEQEQKDLLTGQSWDNRLWLVFAKMRSEILIAFQSAIARELTPLEIVEAVKKSYPQVKAYRLPPRPLKPLREADKPDDKKKEFEFYFGLTNDADWDLSVAAYKDTELPPSRFDNQKYYDSEAGYMRYDWEIEQDITDDFVKQVRDGQVQAANDLGVKDFVWVAIIDKKTCDVCCLPRAGKTSSEIKQMLADGKLDKKACDAVVPPAHPNCLIGSSFISIDYPILKIFRRRYSNEMAKIVTDNGSILEITPNHPILTNRGWQAAKDIKIGDYLFNPSIETSDIGNCDAQNAITSIQNIFDSVAFFSEITTGFQSASDFHNDGMINEQVDIIGIDRELILYKMSHFLENGADLFFEWANHSNLAFCSSNEFLFGIFKTLNGCMSFFGECKTFLSIHSAHANNVGLASIASTHIGLNQPFTNSPPGDPILQRNGQFTHPILIILNRIFIYGNSSAFFPTMPARDNLYATHADALAQIVGMMPNDFGNGSKGQPAFIKPNRVVDFFICNSIPNDSFHVYNLETNINWYIANNLIVHNCRCDIAPVASTDPVEGPDWKAFDDWLNS